MTKLMDFRRLPVVAAGTQFSDRPPIDRSHIVWMWDPDLAGAAQAVVGPTGTITTPVQTQGGPSYYTFGATDVINFGDSLDTTWSNAGGWTIYAALEISTADIVGATNIQLLWKEDVGGGQFEWIMILSSDGTNAYGFCRANYANSGIQFDTISGLTGVVGTHKVPAGKHVFVFVYDPTQARGSRLRLGFNGNAPTNVGSVTNGADGTILDTTAPLRAGFVVGQVGAPPQKISYIFAYNTPHASADVASNCAWIRNLKKWV